MKKTTTMLLTLLFALSFAAAAMAGDWDDCDGYSNDRDNRRYCEIREIELPALPKLTVDGGQNGGIRVVGWDRPEIRVEARISVWNRNEERAKEMAAGIEVSEDNGVLSARGARLDDVSVSFRIQAPFQTDLDLEAHNGGIKVAEIDGILRLETHNGGLSLTNLAGDVEARTQNGGVRVELAGNSWDGSGLDVRTTNGGVKLEIPEDYSAEFSTGTVNGRVNIDFPVTVQGRIDRNIEATLGSGGAPVSVRTTNGSVTVSRL